MKQSKFYVLILAFLFVGCNAKVIVPVDEQPKEQPVKNVIFLIGDGMGLTQVTSGLLTQGSLNLEEFTSIGLSKTSSSREAITDSAAGATAFSIGKKTYNGAIGVSDDGTITETLLETFAKQGMSTGLVATSRITHATPASFFAHQPYRYMGYEIAADMVNSPLTVFVGGGKDHFVNRIDENEGAVDSRNILIELEEKGVSFVNSFEELVETDGRVGYFIADGHPPSMIDGRGDVLPNSVKPVIQKLQEESENGFFLMIEGSQIDWGGHANNAEYIITEMIDFDNAIGEALAFAKEDGQTLVVVTADHETGGFALNAKDEEVKYKHWEGNFSTGGHSATMVPVFAFGPESQQFQGIYENTAIYYKIKDAVNKKR